MLAPCPSCRRHVRAGADACPFCGAACAFEPPVAPLARRMSRAAMVALASSLALVGCGSDEVPVYGAPVPPDAASDGTPDDAGADAAMYGLPPYDSGADTGADDTGGNVNMYGAPPPPADAGDDEGA